MKPVCFSTHRLHFIHQPSRRWSLGIPIFNRLRRCRPVRRFFEALLATARWVSGPTVTTPWRRSGLRQSDSWVALAVPFCYRQTACCEAERILYFSLSEPPLWSNERYSSPSFHLQHCQRPVEVRILTSRFHSPAEEGIRMGGYIE